MKKVVKWLVIILGLSGFLACEKPELQGPIFPDATTIPKKSDSVVLPKKDSKSGVVSGDLIGA